MCAAPVSKVRKDLKLPHGLWQLFSYGRLTSLPTAKQAIWIRGYFRRVVQGQTQAILEWTDEVIWRDVPVGELVAWEIGCVFNPTDYTIQKPQPIASSITACEVQAAFTDKNCTPIRRYVRDGDGNYVFSNPRLLPEESEANTYFLQVAREGLPPLLIPCTTILQSLWGRSSSLVHMLLDSRFLDFDRYVLNTSKSTLNESTGHASIWLRQWSLDSDAKFLSTLAFNAQAVARGQKISLALQAALDPYGGIPHRCIYALPPHSDMVTLKVWGYELKTTAGMFFYVQRIIQTSYTPPFSKLTFDRDNDGRPQTGNTRDKNSDESDARKPIEREQLSKPRNEGSSEFELAQDHPNFLITEDTTDIGQFDSICPGISKLPTEKLSQQDQEFENVAEATAISERRWNRLSTLPGTRRSSAAAIGTILSSGQVLEDPIDTSIIPAGPPLDQLLRQVIELAPFHSDGLLPPGVAHIDVTPVFPWRPSPAHDGIWLFSLPAECLDFPRAWLYSDPLAMERKRGLCLRITFFDSVDAVIAAGYLVELEGRFPRARSKKEPLKMTRYGVVESEPIHPPVEVTKTSLNSPVLFIWREQNGSSTQSASIGHDDLQHLILELAEEGGTSAKEAAARKGIRCRAKRHRTNSIQLGRLLQDLLRLMQSDFVES